MSQISRELLKIPNNIDEGKILQEKYRQLIESSNLNTKNLPKLKTISYIIALDISFFKKEHVEYGVSCAVLWNFKSNKMLQYALTCDIINFPYIPGLLGFREVPLMVKTIQKINIKPDIIICDGHGIIHPRRFGEATHIGYALNTPSIGIAKTPFIGESNWKSLIRAKGKKTPIVEKGDLLGYAICLGDNLKPVFISVGYKIDIELALRIALYLSKGHKQPDPLYLADRLSRDYIKSI